MNALLLMFMSAEDIEKELNGTAGDMGKLLSTVSPSSVRRLYDPPKDTDELHEELLSLSIKDGQHYGESSGANLYLQVAGYKKTLSGSAPPYPLNEMSGYPWETTLPYELLDQAFDFPPDDLLSSLVDIYFNEWNTLLPILHRPTFMRQLAAGLHHTNRSFGANLLVMCAAASRFSNDPRVFMEEYDYHPFTCGWKWFNQVQLLRESSILRQEGSELFDLQFYALLVNFLCGGTKFQALWVLLGVGIRLGQHLGADRRKKGPLTVHDEQMKRAWWALVFYDQMAASNLGRPPAVRPDGFTQDLPVDCDDEYWEHPDEKQRFKQPPNKPSKGSAFIRTIELARIFGHVLQTLYTSPRKPNDDSRREKLQEFDSALNSWNERLPDHLRWDPQMQDPTFFSQSSHLRHLYHFVQIMVHRPFIPLPGESMKLSTPSLLICANTARSSIRLFEVLVARGTVQYVWFMGGVFTCAVILLVNIMAHKHEWHTASFQRDMDDVKKCIQMLRVCTERWHTASKLVDCLTELASLEYPNDCHLSKGSMQEWPAPDTSFDPQYPSPPYDPATVFTQNTPPIIGMSSLLQQPLQDTTVYSTTPNFSSFSAGYPPSGTTPGDEFGLWSSAPTYFPFSQCNDLINTGLLENDRGPGHGVPAIPAFERYYGYSNVS